MGGWAMGGGRWPVGSGSKGGSRSGQVVGELVARNEIPKVFKTL